MGAHPWLPSPVIPKTKIQSESYFFPNWAVARGRAVGGRIQLELSHLSPLCTPHLLSPLHLVFLWPVCLEPLLYHFFSHFLL